MGTARAVRILIVGKYQVGTMMVGGASANFYWRRTYHVIRIRTPLCTHIMVPTNPDRVVYYDTYNVRKNEQIYICNTRIGKATTSGFEVRTHYFHICGSNNPARWKRKLQLYRVAIGYHDEFTTPDHYYWYHTYNTSYEEIVLCFDLLVLNSKSRSPRLVLWIVITHEKTHVLRRFNGPYNVYDTGSM